MLDHMATLLLVFSGTSIQFSIVAATTYILTNNVGRFFFLHSLSSTYYSYIFIHRLFDGRSDWYEIISHCSFDLHFYNN